VFLPLLVQRLAILPDDLHRRQKLLDLEARSQNNHIEIVLLPGGANDAGFSDLADAFRNDLKIWCIKCIKIVGIEDAPLTA
jgi:hypothetical protein